MQPAAPSLDPAVEEEDIPLAIRFKKGVNGPEVVDAQRLPLTLVSIKRKK